MNADEISIVTIIVGNRGACKTLLMTGFEIEALGRAAAIRRIREITGDPDYYKKKKVNNWSSYPVSGLFRLPGSIKPVRLEAEPIDTPRLMRWTPEFENGTIFYDEIDQDADRQEWHAQLPKYLVKGIKVMRHRRLSLTASLQFIDELNVRLYKQADVVIQCRDKAFTPWGKERNLEPGAVASTTWIDKSGIMTGYSYEETHQAYKLDFYGKRYWFNYETEHEVDIVRPVYKMQREVLEISDFETYEAMQGEETKLRQLVDVYRYQNPGTRPRTAEFWDWAKAQGFTGSPHKWGKYLKEIGVFKDGAKNGADCYNFSLVEAE